MIRGPPLAVDGVKISDGALDGDVTVARPDTPEVAIFRPTAPTQILSTGGHKENPWRAYNDASIVSALGERRIVSAGGKVTSTPAGLAPEVLADGEGEIRGVSPDGREVFIATTVAGRTTFRIAGRGQVQPGCKAERVEYLPGPDFASSVADAQLQTPVYRTNDDSRIDCRSGQEVRIPANVTIDDYQIGVLERELSGQESMAKEQCEASLNGNQIVLTHCILVSCQQPTTMSRMRCVLRSTNPVTIC